MAKTIKKKAVKRPTVAKAAVPCQQMPVAGATMKFTVNMTSNTASSLRAATRQFQSAWSSLKKTLDAACARGRCKRVTRCQLRKAVVQCDLTASRAVCGCVRGKVAVKSKPAAKKAPAKKKK